MKRLNKLSLKNCLQFLFITIAAVSTITAQNLDQGKRMINVEKYKEARSIFENQVKANPKDANAYFYLGKLDIIENKLDAAQADFQKGLDADKKNGLNYVGLGQVQLMKNDSTAAVKQFDEALDVSDKKDINVVLAIADAYIDSDSKDMSRPIDLLKKINRTIKRNSGVFERLGDIYLKQVNGSLAIQNYQTAIDYDSTYVPAYIGIGQIYAKIKNYPDAEANFMKAIQIDSAYAPAYKEFGEYYYGRKMYDKAAKMFEKYIQFSEPTTEKSVRYATSLYLAKDYAQAINVIKQVPEQDKSKDAQLQHILAYSYFSVDDAQNGLPAFDQYFKMVDPKEITATDYEFVGKLEAKSGNDSLAIENYKKAIAMDSSKTELHGDIAAMYFKNKNWEAAANEYSLKESATGKPLNALEYFNLGQAYYRMQNFKMADSVYAKFTQLNPDQPIGYYYRALSNAQLDPESEQGLAKPHYEKFIDVVSKMAPDQQAKFKNHLVEAYSYLGYYYFLKKDNANSLQYWQKVQELDPENEQAKTALKQIKK